MYFEYFDCVLPIKTPLLDLDYAVAIHGNIEYYGLFFRNVLKAILTVNTSQELAHIEYAQTDQTYHAKGLLRYLFNRALDKHNTLCSSSSDTDLNQYFWENIIKLPEITYEVYLYDATMQFTKHSRFLEYADIWNHAQSPVLIGKKRKYTSKEIKNLKTINAFREDRGRGDFELWYGRYTPNLGYYNP